MKITPKSDIVRTEAVTRAADKATLATTSGAAGRGEAKSDRIQISDAGRALAGASGLSSERVAQIRGRIQEGAYNSLAVVDEVARRILDGGDV